MNKLVSRSLDILGSTASSIAKEYTSNVSSLIEDAKTIRNQLVKTSTDASDTFAKLKHTNITKKISDWFYAEESKADSDNDEFDAGFTVESSNDEVALDGDKKVRALDTDTMSDITEKQTSTMVKIGRRQTEQSVANTAEIISAFNSRSSEIVTMMGNLNKSVEGINQRLDKLIKASEFLIVDENRRSEERDKGSLFSDGKMSLASIFEVSKSAVKDNAYVTALGSLIDTIKQGVGPEALLSSLLKDTVLKKDLDILGGQSVDKLAKRFNNFIGDAMQTAMTEMVGSKVFKTVFGDITQFEGDTDYGRLVPNHYDTKRAQFDGMTRMSIIKVIPDLLIELNKSVSGKTYHIDKTGSLVEGPKENKFNAVADNLFASSGLQSGVTSRIENTLSNTIGENKVSRDDIEKASKLLAGVIALDMHSTGTRIFRKSDLGNMQKMSSYINTAVTVLCEYKNDPQYWATVCQTILLQVSSGISDSARFIQNINQNLQNTIGQATEFAQSDSSYSSQATRISLDMMANRFFKTEIAPSKNSSDRFNTDETDNNDNNNNRGKSKSKRRRRDGDIKPNYEGKKELIGKYSLGDYVRGIFGILNRGINVKTTNKSNNLNGYGNYDLDRVTTDQLKTDDKFAGLMMGVITDSSGSDAKDLSALVTRGIQDATNAVLNEQGTSGTGGGGLNGFFGSMAGILGASGLHSLGSRALNGTLSNDLKSFFGKGGKGSQYLNQAKNKIVGITNKAADNLPSHIVNDRRFRSMKDNIVGEGGILQNVKNRATNTINRGLDTFETSDKFSGARGVRTALNNRLYRADDNKIKRISSKIDNTVIDDASDMNKVTQIQEQLRNKDYTAAFKTAIGIKNKKLREQMKKDIKKILAISTKRTKGMLDSFDDSKRTPDIGSVLITSRSSRVTPVGNSSITSKILNVVKTGFSKVGKVLGKMLKFVAKMATSGILNITYGLKSIAGGLFGSKQRDADGNVIRDENGKIIRNRGIVKTMTTDLVKAAGKGLKSVGNKVLDMPISKNNSNTLRNMTFTGQWERDENGNIKRDANGKRVMTNTATVGDLIKNPGKILAQSLKNIATDISKSGLGRAVKTVAKTVVSFGKTITDGIKNVFNKIMDSNFMQGLKDKLGKTVGGGKGVLGNIGDKFKNSAFGSGVMSGFNEAKAAKAKLSEAKERASSFINRSVGDIMDILKGTGSHQSALTQLADLIQGIRDDMNENHQEDMDIQNSGSTDEGADTSQSSTIESGQTDPTAGTESASEATSGLNNNNNNNAGGAGSPDITSGSAGASDSSSPGGSGGSAGGGKKRGLVGELLNGLGKVFGGFTQTLLGIFQLVISIVTAMSGFQALIDMVKSILTDGLQPLNSAFESIMKAIKPAVKALKTIISSIAETVTTIVGSLVKVIQPIVEMISPIIEDIFDVLEPILSIITVLVSAIAVPMLSIVKALQPVIEGIGYAMQIVSGLLQISLGSIITVLGGILTGIGAIARFFGAGSGIYDMGKSMWDSGTTMVKTGIDSMGQGITGAIDLGGRLISGEKEDSSKEEKPPTNEVNTDNVNVNSGAMGSGDVTNNYYKYMYGSGNTTMNQHSYGNYMNMSERGCGPVALADAYSRRTGNRISPVALASTMSGSGAYQPNRGTSVASFIQTSNAMGMKTRVGGVTQSSLKRATPTNPITLLGSGVDYGTRPGNDHYVNVIGTDRYGGAYVSNPLTGNVERRSASTLALNSKLGLYGSGDSDDTASFYKLDDTTSAALSNLKSLTSKLTEMFTGNSTADNVKKQIDENDKADKVKTIKRQLSDEEFASVEEEAHNTFLNDNPKRDNETDEEYNARMEKQWNKSDIYNRYIINAGGQLANEKNKSLYTGMLSAAEDLGSRMDTLSSDIKSVEMNSSAGESSASSLTGAVMAPYSPIRYTETNITKATSGESPVHDFFSATSGMSAYTINGGWFGKTNDPNSLGEGTKGSNSEGVAITFTRASDAMAKAITGGVVTYVGRRGVHGYKDPNGGLGNHVKWRDSSGMYHWYMHLADIADNIAEGANLAPGQDIGHVGDTGYSGEKNGKNLSLLRYVVTSAGPYGSTADDGYINPLTYWKFQEEHNQDAVKLTDSMKEKSIWGLYKDKIANSSFFDEASKAGLTPAQTAMIATIGIFEDSAKKLTGEKSLTKVTQDYNGQYAFGLMNWIPSDANSYLGADETMYGSSLSDQLPYMRQAYFDENASHSRAKIVNYDGYASALQSALGYSLKLKQGDRWGPYAETDIAEAMGHYVANALVPAGWNTEPVLSKHIGTAAEAYNWMIANGKAPVSIEGDGKSGKFVSTVSNNAGGGSPDDFIRTLAMVYEGYVDYDPAGTYSWGSAGPIKLRDGSVIDKLRPDCIGMISAAIKHMGYKIKDDAGFGGTATALSQTSYNNIILDSSGNPSPDWEIIPNPDSYQPGDITNTTGKMSPWNHCHSSVPIIDINGYTKGFDAGGTENIRTSANAAIKYLNGDPNYVDALYSAMAPKYAHTILRFVGGTKSGGTNNERGGYSYGKYLIDQDVANAMNNSHQIMAENGVDGYNAADMIKDAYNKTNKKPVVGGMNNEYVHTNTETTVVSNYGSGDVDPWYSSMIQNDNQIISEDIPSIDMSKFSSYDNNTQPITNYINKYEIKTDDDSKRDTFLKKMSGMTFNVRAQRVEELLEELIEKVSGEKSSKKSSTSYSATDPNLFKSNSIPNQIVRLSRG